MLWKALTAQITFLEGGGRFEDAPNDRDGNGRNAPLVCHCIQGNTIDRSEKSGADGIGVTEDVSYTLTKNDRHAVAVYENHGQDSRITGPLEVAPTISRKFGTGGNNVPLVTCLPITISSKQQSLVTSVDKANTLGSNDYKEPQCVAYTPSSFGSYREGCGTLKANGGDLGGGSETLVTGGCVVRRLTPKECERLQGFPDGWTAYGHDGRPISDTQRYKALGNSVAIPCVEFVMGNIAKIMEAE